MVTFTEDILYRKLRYLSSDQEVMYSGGKKGICLNGICVAGGYQFLIKNKFYIQFYSSLPEIQIFYVKVEAGSVFTLLMIIRRECVGNAIIININNLLK